MPFKDPARSAAYYTANKEKIAAYQAAYYAANKEKVAVRGVTYRDTGKEKIAAYQAAYRAANKEKVAARLATYRDTSKEKIAAYQAACRDNLSPYYVASCLKIPVKEVTPELLELKREHLTLHRLAKQVKQQLKKEPRS